MKFCRRIWRSSILQSIHQTMRASDIPQEGYLAIGFFWIAQNMETRQDHSTPPQNSGMFAPLERVCVVFRCLWELTVTHCQYTGLGVGWLVFTEILVLAKHASVIQCHWQKSEECDSASHFFMYTVTRKGDVRKLCGTPQKSAVGWASSSHLRRKTIHGITAWLHTLFPLRPWDHRWVSNSSWFVVTKVADNCNRISMDAWFSSRASRRFSTNKANAV